MDAVRSVPSVPLGGSVVSSTDGDDRPPGRPVLSVVVPTRHEAANVVFLVKELNRSLAGTPAEVLFVDDSDDDTPAVIEGLAGSARPGTGCEVRLLHRPAGRRTGGLGGAVTMGIREARAQHVCVMDADLQHPPSVVPTLLDAARRTGAGLVVASRYCADGEAPGLHGTRPLVSRLATGAARFAFPRRLQGITDPMSGFFLVRKDLLDLDSLRPQGFKVLLEIAVRTPALHVAEVGFRFGERRSGTSKASGREAAAYLRHLVRTRSDLRPRGTLPFRYDIHGVVTVASACRLPELDAFRVATLDAEPTLRVRIGAVRGAGSDTHLAREPDRRRLRFRERLGNAGFAVELTLGDTLDVVASPPLRLSPHVLYTNVVEPILRWTFVSRGYALVHGACISDGRSAYMVTARTDTGKTTTMLKLLDANPYGFIADDLTLVTPNGRVLAYPKPLTISAHTLHAVERARLNRLERSVLGLQSRLHSRSGRRFAFLLTRSGLPVATINTYVQLLVPPPKYPVGRLVPGVAMADEARLSALFVIRRDDDGFEWLEPDDALEILLDNCEDAYGFPPYHSIEAFLLAATGDDLRAAERQIIAGALDRRPAALLSSRSLDWAERIPWAIDEIRGAWGEEPVIDLRDTPTETGVGAFPAGGPDAIGDPAALHPVLDGAAAPTGPTVALRGPDTTIAGPDAALATDA